ncbi:MAG: hypothetical protein PHX69_01500 [Simplicispira sp.]|uniref:hypothetical protein n=1 Tax=Simplicispira sp. TaxID=2015802 RepID=UPI002587B7C3|nr:hypothetical protein [Simplicispira sp.]MDD2690439.1 hypothetical protein [Simplicispira sp.]
MSQLPDPPPAPSPLPRSVRAMGIYLLGLVVLGVLFWALGLPDPWTLAVQWASGIVFVLMAITLALGLLGIVLH